MSRAASASTGRLSTAIRRLRSRGPGCRGLTTRRPGADGCRSPKAWSKRALRRELRWSSSPSSPEGHIALGWVLADYDWDWKRRENRARPGARARAGRRRRASCLRQSRDAARSPRGGYRACAARSRARPLEQAGACRARRLLHARRPARRRRRVASACARPCAECGNHALHPVVRATAARPCGRGTRRGRARSDSLSALAVRGAGAAHARRRGRLRRGFAATDRRMRIRRVVSDRCRACMARGSRRGLRLAGARLSRARSRIG